MASPLTREQFDTALAEMRKRLRPAVLDELDPATASFIQAHLWKYGQGVLNAETLTKAVLDLRHEVKWKVPPAILRRERLNALGQTESYFDARDPRTDPSVAAQAKETTKQINSQADQATRRIIESEINAYLHVTNGRISHGRTESIRNDLRKLAAKYSDAGTALRVVKEAIAKL